MKIMSINTGSSSLKFSLYEMNTKEKIIQGTFERIGISGSFYTIKYDGEKIAKTIELPNHEIAVKILAEELVNYKVIKSLDEIKGIGHRIVQGADYFDKSVIATDGVINIIEDLIPLAPLHNPAAVIGIKAFQKIIPTATPVVVFDTAFHQTIPQENFMYALPYEMYEEDKVRKYGAHGTSHKYVSERMNQILGRTDTKLITCHIGNGASISAIVNGKCLDTSMGFTPNAGVIMGSRTGDIDVSIIPYIMQKKNLTPNDIDTIINKKSGLLGISGISSDSRDIEKAISEGSTRAILAQKMYVRKIIDYIAKYYVLMNGADAIVFTAGVGENSISVRKQIIEGLSALNIFLDEEANQKRGEEIKISSKESKVLVYIIPTDEEIVIAEDTLNLINS